MTTPIREGCLANVKTTLEGITKANGYNYNVSIVTRADGPFFDHLDPSISGQAMCFVEDGLTDHVLETMDGLWVGSMEVFVTMAVRYEPDAPEPLNRESDLESTVRSKIVQDVLTALLSSHTRGSYARNTFITNDAPVVEPEIESLNGWVAVEMRFLIEYDYKQASP